MKEREKTENNTLGKVLILSFRYRYRYFVLLNKAILILLHYITYFLAY